MSKQVIVKPKTKQVTAAQFDAYRKERIAATNGKSWIPSSFAQYKALACPATELFYGGAAGGGKSDFLLVDAVRQVKHSKYRALLMRRTFPELEKSLIMKSFDYYPSFGGKYNSQLHRWKFPSGAIIDFGYSENDKDINNYKSAEYAWIGLDESTTFSQYQIEYIKSRNRSPHKEIRKAIRLASNPTGRSFAYHKKRYITNKKPFTKYIDKKTENIEVNGVILPPLEYMFIPALPTDNAILMENDPQYIQKLSQLPDKERKALLLGSWDIFDGQFFDEWDQRVHVTDPYDIPDSYPRFICLDYGWTQPSAVYWIAVSPDKQLIVYRELWGPGYTPERLAEAMTEMTPASERKLIQYVVADPAIFASKQGEKTTSEVLQSPPYNFYMIKGVNSRVTGWNYFRQAMEIRKDSLDRQYSNLIFFSRCKNAIRTIPLLMYDDKKMDDCDTNQKDEDGFNVDDPSDAIRYGIMSRYTSISSSNTLVDKDANKHFKARHKEFYSRNS